MPATIKRPMAPKARRDLGQFPESWRGAQQDSRPSRDVQLEAINKRISRCIADSEVRTASLCQSLQRVATTMGDYWLATNIESVQREMTEGTIHPYFAKDGHGIMLPPQELASRIEMPAALEQYETDLKAKDRQGGITLFDDDEKNLLVSLNFLNLEKGLFEPPADLEKDLLFILAPRSTGEKRLERLATQGNYRYHAIEYSQLRLREQYNYLRFCRDTGVEEHLTPEGREIDGITEDLIRFYAARMGVELDAGRAD